MEVRNWFNGWAGRYGAVRRDASDGGCVSTELRSEETVHTGRIV